MWSCASHTHQHGCDWVGADEDALRQHVMGKHFQDELPLYKWEKACFGNLPQLDFYIAAIRHKEEQKMPDVGISVDRRALTNAIAETRHVRALVCFVCAQVKVDTGILHKTDITLSRENAKLIDEKHKKNQGVIYYNLSAAFFRSTYMKGDNEQPWRRSPEFENNDWEWRRIFRFSQKGSDDMEMLCCPEDCLPCGGDHDETVLCRDCYIPLCSKCRSYIAEENAGNAAARISDDTMESLPYCIPMALVNDNMWGYTTSLLVKYKVTWIEVAAVMPIWTTMMVYYVEGDYGHLMNEYMQKPRWRTKVRGHCFSFVMPWETILRDLNQYEKTNKFLELPRDEECLSYMCRIQLKVAGRDFHQHLKQVCLRPFVLVLLLYELIENGHPALSDSLPAAVLKERVVKAVEEKYPEHEAHLPLEQRQGRIPPRILQLLEEQQEEKTGTPPIALSLRKMITFEKCSWAFRRVSVACRRNYGMSVIFHRIWSDIPYHCI